jgi:hypothetical protein
MPFSIFKGEKSLTDLVHRLFNIKGPSAQSQVQQASDALLKANPQLKDLSKVPAGAPIAIPAKTPPVRSDQLASGPELIQLFAKQNIQSTFENFAQRLGEVETTITSRLKTGITQLQASEISAAVKKLTEQGARFENEGPDNELDLDPVKTLQPILDASQARLRALGQLRESLASFNVGMTFQPAQTTKDKK